MKREAKTLGCVERFWVGDRVRISGRSHRY